MGLGAIIGDVAFLVIAAEIVAGAAFVTFMVCLKYARARERVMKREEKADVDTLFDGRK